MQQYPYYSAQILTDNVFVAYGGQTGTSTAAQRQSAYLLAEEQMTEHLMSFLLPTIISGTSWYKGGTLFETEFGNVTRVLNFSSVNVEQLSPLTTSINTGSVLVRNAEFGYLDVILPCDYWNIYSNTVVYESGFSTGTSTSPTMLSALTLAAQINLNEWDASLSNEGTADVGVQSFSNQSYAENRTKLLRTVFGNGAMAQRIASLTKKYRTKPVMRFR